MSNIFSIDDQLKDILSNKIVKNPFNIMWLIEYAINNKLTQSLNPVELEGLNKYYQSLKEKESKFTKYTKRKINTYSYLVSIVRNENAVTERIRFLIKQGANIDKYCEDLFKTIPLKSIKNLFDLGFSINHMSPEKVFELFKIAITRSNSEVSHLLYRKVDFSLADDKNNTVAHIVANKKRYELLKDQYRVNIDSFYIQNSKKLLPVDILVRHYNKENDTNKAFIENFIISFLLRAYKENKALPIETFNNLNNTAKDIMIKYEHTKLTNLLSNMNGLDSEKKEGRRVLSKI